MNQAVEYAPLIRLERITARTVENVCRLSETLPHQQRKLTVDNALAIAQAHFSKTVWLRAIYADETPMGFLSLHIGQDPEADISCDGVLLWRFMIAYPYQGKGYGRRAMACLIEHLQEKAVPVLYTACVRGPEGPEGFFTTLGFEPTGEVSKHGVELCLRLA